MKNLFLVLVAFITTNVSAAVVVPAYPLSNCDKHICASLSGKRTLIVTPTKNFLSGKVRMGYQVDEKNTRYVDATVDRGGKRFIVELAGNGSKVSVFFVNDKNQYDSDFGRNFNFEIR